MEDLVISCVRQVRALRNFGHAIRSNALAAQTAGQKREGDAVSRAGEKPELKRRKPHILDSKDTGAKAKSLPDPPKDEESETGEFEEESEEEGADQGLAPLAGKDHRRPPEPDGPPPHLRKQRDRRGDHHRTTGDHKQRHSGGHSGGHKPNKPRHRAGRKHQRLGRLEHDPTTPVHIKLSNHYLDTLATDKGQDSLSRLP